VQRPAARVIAGVLVVLGARLAGGQRPGVADVHLPAQETLLEDRKTEVCACHAGLPPPSLPTARPRSALGLQERKRRPHRNSPFGTAASGREAQRRSLTIRLCAPGGDLLPAHANAAGAAPTFGARLNNTLGSSSVSSLQTRRRRDGFRHHEAKRNAACCWQSGAGGSERTRRPRCPSPPSQNARRSSGAKDPRFCHADGQAVPSPTFPRCYRGALNKPPTTHATAPQQRDQRPRAPCTHLTPSPRTSQHTLTLTHSHAHAHTRLSPNAVEQPDAALPDARSAALPPQPLPRSTPSTNRTAPHRTARRHPERTPRPQHCSWRGRGRRRGRCRHRRSHRGQICRLIKKF